jgi:uncharacterized membrane protein YdjX (TVP38/TMEM64 family)
MSKETDPQPVGWWRAIGRVSVFVGCAVGLGLLGMHEPFRHAFGVENIERIADRLGAYGPAVILLAGLVSPLFFLPRWPLCFVAGLLYGVVWGALLATVASLLGAALQFLLARTFLAGYAKRLIARSRLAGTTIPHDKTFAAVFLLRAFPLSNFVLTNLLAGALHLRTDVYIAASFLGMIPSSIMYSAWGKFAKKPGAGFLVLIFSVLFLLVAGGIYVGRRRSRWLQTETTP